MELRHLRYFVAVAEELNFTRAAARLHIGQPPLSMQIRDLEGEMGVRLFERTQRRVALTPAGQCLLEHAYRILGGVREAVEAAQRVARGELGELRVGFTSSLPFTDLLPDALHAYHRRFPAVRLQLNEMFTPEQFGALARGELDVGFVRLQGARAPDGIALREIARNPLRLVVNASHRLAGDEGFGRDPGLFRGEHDRRAVGVVGADVVHRATGHASRAHPDVGLHVADQVAQVQGAVGVGQCVGDERGAGHVAGRGGRRAIIACACGAPARRAKARKAESPAYAGPSRIDQCPRRGVTRAPRPARGR